jgi:hypothetical protein
MSSRRVLTPGQENLRSILKKAFKEGRGPETILLIQWLRAKERHLNKAGAKLAEIFNFENAGQPQAVRALNLMAEKEGLGVRYNDNGGHTISQQPDKMVLN